MRKRAERYTDPALRHFAVADGAAALCRYLLSQTLTTVQLERHVERVDIAHGNTANAQWRVTTTSGYSAVFDGVVLTPPPPQLLGFNGDIRETLAQSEVGRQLAAVKYSSRWALGIAFENTAWCAAHELGYGARYFDKSESESICYVAVDEIKRGCARTISTSTSGPTLVVHASVPWSLKHGAQCDHAEESRELRAHVQATLLAEAARLLPSFVGAHTAAGVKLHKWRYSQVYRGLANDTACELVSDAPLLLVAGDGLTSASGFDSCARAASTAAAHLARWAHL